MKRKSSTMAGLVYLNQSFLNGYVPGLWVAGWLVGVLLLMSQRTTGQTFPANFAGVQLATGLDPVGMDIAPDGRVFLTEKSGKIRVVRNGSLLSNPFMTIPNVDNYNERGLQGIALDPNFSNNNYVYVYYTYRAPGSPVSNNRVSRFTANGDVVIAGSEKVLLDIDPLSSAGNHNGGSLAFMDGRLLISVGENADGDNAQSFSTLKGKLLRLNADGSIPTDNPFYGSASGNNRAIWALGLRNPFRIAVQRGTANVFINDVGQSAYEEINQGAAGKNYGWPGIEGNKGGQTPPANYQDPFYAYNHDTGCSITAGDFYSPPTNQFPDQYNGKYFFADYCGGWIKTIDPANRSVATFATGLNRPLAIKTGADGSLYFIARGGIGGGSDADNTSSNGGVLWKVTYTGNGQPVVGVQPSNKTASVGESVTFSVSASGTPAPSYQWQRNGTSISGANSSSYTLSNVAQSDNGAVFRVIVSNSAGSVTSSNAVLTVQNNQKPTATIVTPSAGKTYTAGDVISFSGTGTDPEDGNLPASAFSWRVDLYHFDSPAHYHPVLAATNGITSGSFTIPVSGETSPNVLYRVYLTVTDSKGTSTTSSVDVNPNHAIITLVTQPAGLNVKFDGTLVTTPYTFTGVSGVIRNLEAVAQSKNGADYIFSSWSDGGGAAHTLRTPSGNSTITATYVSSSNGVPGLTNGLNYVYIEGAYGSLPDFGSQTPVKTGTTADFNLGLRNRDDNFGFQFKGYVDIPNDGQYTFYTQSDDGSRLYIDGNIVVDNDGLHGAVEKAGSVTLKAGKHPIEVTFFEREGDQVLNVSYEGAGISKRAIPASALFSVPANNPGTGSLANGLYEIEPQHAIGKRLTARGSTADGAEAQIAGANGSSEQVWKVMVVENNMYEISPQQASSKRLDVNGASPDDGGRVQLWSANATSAQRWKLYDKGNGVYELEPQCAPGKRLDVYGADTGDGARVVSWSANGNSNQRWKLIYKSAARLAAKGTESGQPESISLANYPNPFVQTTTLTYELPALARQSVIQVHSLKGELVRSIDVSGTIEGRYELSRGDLPSGVYMYSLLVDGKRRASQRLVIMK